MPGFPGGLARMGRGNKQDDVTKPNIARVDSNAWSRQQCCDRLCLSQIFSLMRRDDGGDRGPKA